MCRAITALGAAPSLGLPMMFAQALSHLEGRRVLVTGGAGFVGSSVVHRLIELGARVTVLDDLYTGSASNLPAGDVDFVEGSVTDRELVQRVVADAECVLHLAARNIIVSTRDPREDYEVNIGGTLNVLLAAREFETPKIVFTSSASVYGNPRYLPINEDDTVNLLSPYSVSKFAGESYCKAFYESYEVPAAVVRYSNVYGVGQHADNPYCGVVAKFFEAALRGAAPAIHGDGEQTRDFTYIDDAVEATLLAAVSERACGQVYNIGTGRETSVNDLVRKILTVAEIDVEAEHVDRRDIDNIRRRVLNIEKIRRELRWTPAVTVTEGLRKTFEWLKSSSAAD